MEEIEEEEGDREEEEMEETVEVEGGTGRKNRWRRR